MPILPPQSYSNFTILPNEWILLEKSIKYLLKADSIKEKTNNYINEEYAWNETVYDILSLCYFNIGDMKNSLKYVKLAVNKNPNDERLTNNLEIILKNV